jgi:glycosyltransferase involved in cell wall biosynthesis
MIFIVHSETNKTTAETNLGTAEYSYYFVLKEFLPVLQQLGTVIQAGGMQRDVDAIYFDAQQRGEDCIFLSFSPPHRTPRRLACPTVPVFAWEFDTIPSETWFGEAYQDWRFVLSSFGRAITHSNFAAVAVKNAMGADFPVVSIPAPVWDRFCQAAGPDDGRGKPSAESPTVAGAIIDTRNIDWPQNAGGLSRVPKSEEAVRDGGSRVAETIEINGIVYTAILNPFDGRKNLVLMIRGFIWAFRDTDDAVLVLKLVTNKSRSAIEWILRELYRFVPFKCRVLLIDSYLSDDDYRKLLLATTYALNTSRGEGQCLPLMEYMSAGKPAVAPRHTAMEEYVSAANAFVIDSSSYPAIWPHDPRGAFRALTRQIDMKSLVGAFRNSYGVAKHEPARYREMSGAAREALKKHCSTAVVAERLTAFVKTPSLADRNGKSFGAISSRKIEYILGSKVDFAERLDARRYLLSGWSHLELGHGVWSIGDTAELLLRIRPAPSGPLELRATVSAFVHSMNKTMTVIVSANGRRLTLWKFSTIGVHDSQSGLRKAIIPTEIAANGETVIRFDIRYPMSPLLLGMSDDFRMLGMALRELSIVACKAPT